MIYLSFLKLTTTMHKLHGEKSGKRKKFLRQLGEFFCYFFSLKKPLFKNTHFDIYIYFVKFSDFPSKGAKKSGKGVGKMGELKKKKVVMVGRESKKLTLSLISKFPFYHHCFLKQFSGISLQN